MRIGINSLFLKPNQVGGAEFGLRGLLTGFAQHPDIELYVFINRDLLYWINALNLGDSLRIVPINILGNRFVSEFIQLPTLVNQYWLDGLINFNYFTPWRSLLNCPCFTIIHDLNYLYFPNQFSWHKKIWLRLAHGITLAQADRTITVSEFVKQDIQKNYGFKHTLNAIYNAILWDRLKLTEIIDSEQLQRLSNQTFVLSVAHHYQHKNLATLVKAFGKLPEHLSKIKLVLVGQLPESLVGMRRDRCDDIRQLVQDLGLEDRVYITGYISDRELAWYYHHADLFAFPSLFEGFGMPPVEALGMGLPVLTTRCTAIPEVTMNLAEYVENPLDVDEWCDRITEMLGDRNRYLPTASTVQQIRQAYAPVAIAKQYIDLFGNVTNN
jgi:glycosyltransferase involved in cell wall biosynthesis